MTAIIILNVVFAAAVITGIVGMLARSIGDRILASEDLMASCCPTRGERYAASRSVNASGAGPT